MSEEEKEAIEELKNRQGYRVDFKCKRCNSGDVFIIPPEVLYGKEIDIALNLIDKLREKIIQISEICIDESKCHISTKDAIEEIRRVI